MRCPACGWSNTLKNYPGMINKLKNNINDSTLERLNGLFLTTLDNLTAYTLLKSCQDIEDEIIKHCITIWERKGLEEKGFDVYYFIGILKNENKRFENKLLKEKKRLEALPPDLEEN
jgi:hypothetical protein|tara:strand:+ start:1132 stop:1482 length:351 start_codon:yes stop_codon:yes gene_type:complete